MLAAVEAFTPTKLDAFIEDPADAGPMDYLRVVVFAPLVTSASATGRAFYVNEVGRRRHLIPLMVRI